MHDKITLADRLRTLRMEKHCTQEQLAKYLEVSRSTYSYYELGRTEPSIASIILLANYYHISVSVLLNGIHN